MKRLISILIFIVLFLVIQPVHSQNWPKIYGGNFHSLFSELGETYDRGYIMTGYIYLPYGFCRFIYLIKTDINGNILWFKKIGDMTHQFGASNSEITNDQGLIISASTSKYSSGDFDPVFIKTNVCGEIEWCRVLTCPDQNYGTDVIQTGDGSYIGLLTYYGVDTNYSRISLVKMDQNGEPVWIQRLAQEDSLISNEEGRYLYLTSDSNYLISGSAFHPGYRPFWINTDTSGIQIWDLFWNSLVGEAHKVIEKDSGIFYSTSWGIDSNEIPSPILLKFDNSGNPIGSYNLLGDTIVEGSAVAINSLNDTTLLIGLDWKNVPFPVDQGFSEIIMTDTMGNIIKRKFLLSDYRSPGQIIIDSDNKILVSGFYMIEAYFNIYLWKMNADLEDDTLYTLPMTYDSLCPYQITSDTVDLDCELFVNIEDIPTKEEYESTIKISPNPATDWILLTFPDIIRDGPMDLVVYDLFGREVIRKDAVSANRMITLEISGLSSGLYVVVGKDRNGNILTGKFIIAR
jgi:hypothetical protein